MIDYEADYDDDSSESMTSPTPAQMRKSNKPLLEKKRRARINRSLEDLKSLVLEALKKDTARYSKLEKADILEMTVSHLREIQRYQTAVAMAVDPTVTGKYRSGFNECAQEVDRYLGTIDSLTPDMRMRLLHHLGNCMNQVSSMAPRPGLASLLHQFPAAHVTPPSATPVSALPGGYGCGAGMPFGGLHLVNEPGIKNTRALSPTQTSNSTPTTTATTPAAVRSHDSDVRSHVTPRFHPYLPRDTLTRKKPLQPTADNFTRSMPLAEKNQNLNDTNNNASLPCKAEKMDDSFDKPMKQVTANDGIRLQANLPPAILGLDINVKQEPVWRPW